MSTAKKSRRIPSKLRYELLAELHDLKAAIYREKASKAQRQGTSEEILECFRAGIRGEKYHA